jgi:hypothetical protein
MKPDAALTTSPIPVAILCSAFCGNNNSNY